MTHRLCTTHKDFVQPMCLIPSPVNPKQALMQIQQNDAEGRRRQSAWTMEPSGTLRSAEGGVLTLDHRTVLIIAPAHVVPDDVSDHRHTHHQFAMNQHWIHREDGQLCLLPTEELCLVTEPDNHIFQPAIRSYHHDQHRWRLEAL